MTNERTSTYSSTHRLKGELLHFDLGTEKAEVQNVAAAATIGHSAKTLVKEGPLSITLVSLKKGSFLEPHQVAGPTSIQCLEGNMILTTDAGDLEIASGHVAVLDAGVRHSVKASADCSLLLTLCVPTT